MDSVLVYSDSLTWGIIPNTRNSLPFDERPITPVSRMDGSHLGREQHKVLGQALADVVAQILRNGREA